jgi:hypothetical protein
MMHELRAEFRKIRNRIILNRIENRRNKYEKEICNLPIYLHIGRTPSIAVPVGGNLKGMSHFGMSA